MLLKALLSTRSNLTAAINLPIFGCHSNSIFAITLRRLFSDSSGTSHLPPQSRVSQLPRVGSLVGGCDYKHWLVVMHPPENYLHRDEIIRQYIETLAMALVSEKAAMESIYSVSTKYYYAFSCKVAENVTHKIKSLPRVKWVFPDSYLCAGESGYGGEPYIDGKAVLYEEKYHAEWPCDDRMVRTWSRKHRNRRRGSRNSQATND